ncbi:MAG: GNAT family N-acetyltransferase [Candidatus Gracilibacteria bacterium]|nr:GNAT family N-acetyltransferase [Candidatus Gracilibacteria bacterium]
MNKIDIKWELVKDRKTLYKAFLSCKKTFGEEELDPYKWWIEDYESTRNGKNIHPYYCILGFYKNKVIAGISWNIFNIENIQVAGIGYLWVDKLSGMQHKGIGSLLLNRAESFIENNSKKIGAFFLESNKDIPELKIKSSVGFWEKQNYKKLDKFNYFSPCVKFDSHSGKPLLKEVPLEFMVKTIEKKVIEKNFIKKIISVVYKDWYYQKKEDFSNDSAFNKANKYIDTKLEEILKSL